MDAIAEVKQAMKEGTIVIGSEKTMKLLRQSKVKKIFLASNTSKKAREEIMHYSSIAKVPVELLSITNEDVGTMCKKPFSISVLSVRSE
ncbi:ribosomal L7Ae/L30e/S12e/Gadd45 family protein [Candidatus Woesearchaeota archaeon]|nr:ribosomal L7Ae/L30e/S12e/Gadd45 family protein [Candidatus Woesearchaeota archaeon]